MEVEVRIEGVTPLLLHRFTDEAADNATNGQRTSMEGDRGTPREQAEACLYKSPTGELILPAPNLFCCLIEGGKFFKTGKRQWTTNKTSLVPAAISLDAPWYMIQHDEPWEVDTRPVRIPSTGGRILRHRPSFNDWAIDFRILLEEQTMSVKACRDLVDAALAKIGLGDFRPACKGMYGRSKVTQWRTAKG